MLLFLASCCILGTCVPCCFDDFNNMNISSAPLTHTQQQMIKSASIKAAEMSYEHVKKNKTKKIKRSKIYKK